jgi:hypothetical protein
LFGYTMVTAPEEFSWCWSNFDLWCVRRICTTIDAIDDHKAGDALLREVLAFKKLHLHAVFLTTAAWFQIKRKKRVIRLLPSLLSWIDNYGNAKEIKITIATRPSLSLLIRVGFEGGKHRPLVTGIRSC